MHVTTRVALISGVLAFVAGFVAAAFLLAPRSDPDQRTDALLKVGGPENAIIMVERFPPGWPRTFPLPSDTEPKWAVASEGRLWACFTYPPSHVGFGGTRLLRFFREHLPIAGYQIGPTTEAQEATGLFVGNLGFFRNDGPDHEGKVSVPLTAGALRLGGIPCRFSIEIQYFPE